MTKSDIQHRLKLTVLLILAFASVGFLLFSYAEDSPLHFFAGLVFAASFVWIMLKWKVRAEQPGFTDYDYSESTDARWCSKQEFDDTNNPDRQSNRDYWIGGRFTRCKPAHYTVLGGSGLGKTTALLIPNFLIRPSGSMVGVDIKGELAYTTIRAMLEYNQVVKLIDPLRMQDEMGARHGVKPCGFNVFDFILKNPDEILDTCASIAYYLCPDVPGTKDTYWIERSRGLIKTILAHIATAKKPEERNLFTLYKLLRLPSVEFTNLLIDMKNNKKLDGLISIAAQEWLGMEDAGATMAGILSNAQNNTAFLESAALRDCLSRSDFDPYSLSRDGNVTLYICIPDRFMDTHVAFLRLVVGLCLKACNTKPNANVRFFLDEFPMMKKMIDVQRNFAFGRGQNIELSIYAQSITALRDIYGESWESFLANSAVIQAFGGQRDLATQKYISELCGKRTVIKGNRSNGTSTSKDGSTKTTSTSYSTEKQPLITAEEISRMDDSIITICDGRKAVLQNLPYYKNIYENVDANSEGLTDEERETLRNGGKLVDEFYEGFMKKADIPLNFM
ncbi:MAG: type IV secretory system conjugative DNA transfer family protein [Niastella sp.]|nr:type IV secretory system conjugative DNA transfer family protein [Niastella sp.]